MPFYEKQWGAPMLFVNMYFMYNYPPWELIFNSVTLGDFIEGVTILIVQLCIFIGYFGVMIIDLKPRIAIWMQCIGFYSLFITIIVNVIILIGYNLFF